MSTSRPGALSATPPRVWARTLWRADVMRGITSFALSAYVTSQQPVPAPDVARAIAVFWIVDGLVILWASGRAEVLALSRTVFVLRGVIAIVAGVVILGLPLGAVFGPWRPGQTLLLMLVSGVVLVLIGFHIAAGAFDVVITREIRRRIPGEWSFALGAAFSVALGAVVAATFAVSPLLLGYVLSAIPIVVGFALFVGAARLYDGRATSPAFPPKH
jgi:uncharacterized membrane protein HdeD (DUF308 family)